MRPGYNQKYTAFKTGEHLINGIKFWRYLPKKGGHVMAECVCPFCGELWPIQIASLFISTKPVKSCGKCKREVRK